MGDIEKRKEIEAEGEHEDNSSTWLSKAMAFLKVVAIVGCLYFFICSLEILSSAFRLIAGSATGKLLKKSWNNHMTNILDISGELFSFADNPLVGLMVGVLGTVLVQSSSTFTSIIVAAVGSGGMSFIE